MPKHLIALDIDGTIVDYDGSLSDPVRQVLTQLAEAGHHLVVSTGRALPGALEVVHALDLKEGFVVCSNGSVVVKLDPALPLGWEMHHVVSFDPKDALEKMHEALPNALFLVEDPDLHRWASGPFPAGELAESDTLDIVDFEQLLEKRATRIVMREVNGTAEEFAEAVDRLGLHEVSYSVGWSNWLDIAPDGISKASGLELVESELGIDHELSIGAGDGLNDIEMIEWVHHAIVMGQSKDVLKQHASVVTKSVDEDGLAVALVDYFDLDPAVLSLSGFRDTRV
ncbi:MAG: Cof-type HAD-IIB family hydrolase [Brevibacterium sp.]|uniref:HAD family hydrolase n=1 Tax=Brevibacterium sp. TaxID=1701 RepID=UPI002647A4CB|nr:HAD family hydrolase [Brevibacterium sp.]MDN5834295.1 Cof-type HAD-IIB family hydrolase [Brevibacterium sp.]MDN5876900.1 Cof-type HAD-IIB family hydrolase [Brevibacterium sp.]MDN6123591.1 Cof-type HAD-IIB family hydrolase [Brevibacterium sp.]MDN6158952.1 Cof-type HAD-IIB family hydrolase [Brevibacterium sp.]MDN6176537.1 Cof-type HAD-IIB family hydrolase [Brevibacterium sp.]